MQRITKGASSLDHYHNREQGWSFVVLRTLPTNESGWRTSHTSRTRSRCLKIFDKSCFFQWQHAMRRPVILQPAVSLAAYYLSLLCHFVALYEAEKLKKYQQIWLCCPPIPAVKNPSLRQLSMVAPACSLFSNHSLSIVSLQRHFLRGQCLLGLG